MPHKRRICFVSGSRAEFGLMESVLRAIEAHPRLKLQIIATGMHLDRTRGSTFREIEHAGFRIDALVPWNTRATAAAATGEATAGIARALGRLNSDIVIVVGDRVEAFAGAAAAAIDGRVLAHVHGGDRALGQVDDSLRHAITKLAHIHLAATQQSARRIIRMGEQRFRVHVVGAPGIDGIASLSSNIICHELGLKRRGFALVVYHPTDSNVRRQAQLSRQIFESLSGFARVVIVMPNNDPGAGGVVKSWKSVSRDPRVTLIDNLSRGSFLGLLRDCAVLVGNSSSGIIEGASFGTPVIDIGDRQRGRERSASVIHVPHDQRRIARVASRFLDGRRRMPRRNVYGGRGTATKIAHKLATMPLDEKLLRKLIAY